MTTDTIIAEFRRTVGESVQLAAEGINRYRVFTPFLFEDGDHLAVVLKRDRDCWYLSDEGHTYMHLTYVLDEKVFQRGTRQKIISNALSIFNIEDRDGELRFSIPDERFGDALFNYIQALLKITDVTYLTKERARSTFMEDFRSLIIETVPDKRYTFNWHEPERDPDAKYAVDCKLNGMPKPSMVFALMNDHAVGTATISLLQFERWGLPHNSIAIFEEQESISRKDLARFSDVCEKQFSSLGANKDRIASYLLAATSE